MEPMDIDDIVDVPDTPVRLAKQMTSKRSGVKEESHSLSKPCHSVQQKFSDEGTEIQPVVIDSGSRRLSMRAPKCTSSCGNSLHPINSAALSMASSPSSKNALWPVVNDSGSRRLSPRPPKCTSSSSNSLHPINNAGFSVASSSSSKNPLLFRKKTPTYQGHDSIHTQHVQIENPSFGSKSRSSSFQDQSFVDLTERNLHRPGSGNAFPGGKPGSGRFESSERSGLANGDSSSHGLTNFFAASGNVNEGTDDMSKVIPSIGNGQGAEFVGNIRNKPGNIGSLSLGTIGSSPRVNKQKRLVRNGCISPNNIAKAKQLAGKDNNGCLDVSHDNKGSMTSNGPPVSFDIRELVANDHNSHTRKGKGVINYPCTSKEPDLNDKHLQSRCSSSFNEKAMESSNYIRGAGKRIEALGGWRSTHNRTRELNSTSSDEEQFVMMEMDVPRCASQGHENRMARKEKESSVAIGDDYPKDPNLVSSERVSTLPSRKTVSHPRTRLGRLNRHPSAANTLIKRQKQGSTLSTLGECSTSVSDDSEIVFLSSSAEPSNSRSTSGSVGNLQPIAEVDEFFPDSRHNAHNEDARARQVEADELLARELQEQLYNDVPVIGAGEVDAHMALALQLQDDSNHAFSSSGSLIPNLRRQSHSRPSSNLSRRGSLARASTLGRMTRLRSRFPGQSRTLVPSSGRTSLFPANMDVDVRMHILGALEAFSDMEAGTGIFQTHRDFNENDYETLLALDENNDHHGGASIHLINGLPQSTLQSDNFDGTCAICLETPTIGDTIRHLPCLHKFHKDCIDPWLRRRTSCPICKSSIT